MSSSRESGGSSRDPLAELSRAESRLQAEARAAGGDVTAARWVARERERAVEEKKARLWLTRVALGLPGAVLSFAAVVGFAQERCGLGQGGSWCGFVMESLPPQRWMFGVGRWLIPLVALALVGTALARWRAISAQPATSDFLEVYTHRAAEVVWAYGVETKYTGAVSGTKFTVTACLPDGNAVSTTAIEKHELQAVLRSFPNAVLGYSDARRDAFVRDPRSVR